MLADAPKELGACLSFLQSAGFVACLAEPLPSYKFRSRYSFGESLKYYARRYRKAPSLNALLALAVNSAVLNFLVYFAAF